MRATTVYGWRYLVNATEVSAALAESNDSLPPGEWLKVTCGLTSCTPGSAPGPALANEYGRTLPLPFLFRYASGGAVILYR